MTTAAPGESLSPRIEAVERELGELHAGLAAGRRTRRIILLLVLLVLAGIGWMFYSLYAQVTSDEFMQEVTTAAQEHLEMNQSIYQNEVEMLLEKAKPLVVETLKVQVEKDRPRLQAALDEQRQIMIDGLQPKLEELVQEQHKDVLDTFETKLVNEFPEAQNESVRRRIRLNLEEALAGLFEKYYVDQFTTQFQALLDTWEEFPVADAPQEGDEPLSTQLVGHLFELMLDVAALREEPLL